MILGFPLSFIAGLKCQKTLSAFDEVGEPLLTTIKFRNDKLKDTIYLVKKRWGVAGNHQIIALTKKLPVDNHWQPNSQDLIWEGDNAIFYQQQNDTINIFTLQLPGNAQEWESKQVVQIRQIDGDAFHKLRKQAKEAIKVEE